MSIYNAPIRFVACLALLIVLYASTSAQGTDSRASVRSLYKNRFYLGFNLMPKAGGISSGKIPELDIKNKKKTSADFSIEGGYFFTEMLGVSAGIGMSSYASILSLDGYTTSYDAVDVENENFTMQINGKSIREDQKVRFISVPVCMVFRYPAGEKMSFFIKGGLVLNIPGVNTYESDGTFTYKGYYPAYPVTLENVPVGGFYNDRPTSVKGDLKIKSMVTSLITSTGFSLYLNKNLQLTLSGCFSTAGNISDYESNTNFILSSKTDEIKSFMAGAKTAGVKSFGINAGVRLYLR